MARPQSVGVTALRWTPPKNIKTKEGQQWWYTRLRQVYRYSSIWEKLWFTDAAKELFSKEIIEIGKFAKSVKSISTSYASHINKHKGALAELCIVFHFFSPTIESRIGKCANPLIGKSGYLLPIKSKTVQTAINYLRKIRMHSWILYNEILNESEPYTLAQHIGKSIVASDEKPEHIARHWLNQHCKKFKHASDAVRREAIQILTDANWLEDSKLGKYNNWPKQFTINQKVYEMFEKIGREHKEARDFVLNNLHK